MAICIFVNCIISILLAFIAYVRFNLFQSAEFFFNFSNLATKNLGYISNLKNCLFTHSSESRHEGVRNTQAGAACYVSRRAKKMASTNGDIACTQILGSFKQPLRLRSLFQHL